MLGHQFRGFTGHRQASQKNNLSCNTEKQRISQHGHIAASRRKRSTSGRRTGSRSALIRASSHRYNDSGPGTCGGQRSTRRGRGSVHPRRVKSTVMDGSEAAVVVNRSLPHLCVQISDQFELTLSVVFNVKMCIIYEKQSTPVRGRVGQNWALSNTVVSVFLYTTCSAGTAVCKVHTCLVRVGVIVTAGAARLPSPPMGRT